MNVKDFFNEAAPTWDAREKTPDAVKLALLRRLDLPKGAKVLDVACGTGVVTGLIHELTDAPICGIDVAPRMIEIAREKYRGATWARFEVADLMTYAPTEKYDYAVIYNAYPHFLSPEMLARKLAELLTDGGRFAVVHSLSRAQLDSHHKGAVSPISRSLKSPLEEAAFFTPHFRIDVAEESDRHYLIIGTKK